MSTFIYWIAVLGIFAFYVDAIPQQKLLHDEESDSKSLSHNIEEYRTYKNESTSSEDNVKIETLSSIQNHTEQSKKSEKLKDEENSEFMKSANYEAEEDIDSWSLRKLLKHVLSLVTKVIGGEVFSLQTEHSASEIGNAKNENYEKESSNTENDKKRSVDTHAHDADSGKHTLKQQHESSFVTKEKDDFTGEEKKDIQKSSVKNEDFAHSKVLYAVMDEDEKKNDDFYFEKESLKVKLVPKPKTVLSSESTSHTEVTREEYLEECDDEEDEDETDIRDDERVITQTHEDDTKKLTLQFIEEINEKKQTEEHKILKETEMQQTDIKGIQTTEVKSNSDVIINQSSEYVSDIQKSEEEKHAKLITLSELNTGTTTALDTDFISEDSFNDRSSVTAPTESVIVEYQAATQNSVQQEMSNSESTSEISKNENITSRKSLTNTLILGNDRKELSTNEEIVINMESNLKSTDDTKETESKVQQKSKKKKSPRLTQINHLKERFSDTNNYKQTHVSSNDHPTDIEEERTTLSINETEDDSEENEQKLTDTSNESLNVEIMESLYTQNVTRAQEINENIFTSSESKSKDIADEVKQSETPFFVAQGSSIESFNDDNQKEIRKGKLATNIKTAIDDYELLQESLQSSEFVELKTKEEEKKSNKITGNSNTKEKDLRNLYAELTQNSFHKMSVNETTKEENTETFDTILEYLYKHSKNPLLLSLKEESANSSTS